MREEEKTVKENTKIEKVDASLPEKMEVVYRDEFDRSMRHFQKEMERKKLEWKRKMEGMQKKTIKWEWKDNGGYKYHGEYEG